MSIQQEYEHLVREVTRANERVRPIIMRKKLDQLSQTYHSLSSTTDQNATSRSVFNQTSVIKDKKKTQEFYQHEFIMKKKN